MSGVIALDSTCFLLAHVLAHAKKRPCGPTTLRYHPGRQSQSQLWLSFLGTAQIFRFASLCVVLFLKTSTKRVQLQLLGNAGLDEHQAGQALSCSFYVNVGFGGRRGRMASSRRTEEEGRKEDEEGGLILKSHDHDAIFPTSARQICRKDVCRRECHISRIGRLHW